MPPLWGKSSSKEAKNKINKESFIDTLHRKFKNLSEEKFNIRSSGSRRRSNDIVSEKGSRFHAASRSPSPFSLVSRCQSFSERPQAQPLPLPALHLASIGRVDSEISITTKTKSKRCAKPSCLPLPKAGCVPHMTYVTDVHGDLASASISSYSSIDSDDPVDSNHLSPETIDYESGTRTANGPSSTMHMEHPPTITPKNSREVLHPTHPTFNNQILSMSPKQGPSKNCALQSPSHGAFGSAPDSSMSSPSRSPMRAFGTDQITNSAFWAGKPYPEVPLLASGHCSSSGSGQNSGHNSMGGDMSGQLFWQHSRGSPECSPIPSPRMTSPGPSSRINSGAVTPLHPRAGGAATETSAGWLEDGKQGHRLPLPPISIPSPSPFPTSSSPSTVSSFPRSPGKADNPISPGSRWKKGKLLGRGAFGHVYEGFNRESGEMCAMKEIILFSDDAKSKESAKQFGQEIALLSSLQHPNIVQYYGSEMVDDKLYIYLEYMSGGSIYKLLQEYGQFGELAIRSYTQQILSGLAYLHATNTVHRDIKGANILVDPSGRVKLADFGMAKHITGQSCPLSFKGSPYWMAPEVIKNSNGCNLAVDIWSLGCTVLEMATTKPPWGQYEGVVAMFKIGNSKELPAIPDNLSGEGKDFVRKCLQRNPVCRPTAAQLLEHPFVKNAAPVERPILASEPTASQAGITDGVRTLVVGHVRNLSSLEAEELAVHQSRATKGGPSSDRILKNISCPVSPIGSPLLHSRSSQHAIGRLSPPLSSPIATSGSSTPLTGGNGAIPFHHLKQSAYLHEGFGSMPRSPKSFYVNGSTYHDPKPDLFQRTPPGSHVLWDQMSSEKDYLRNDFVRHAHTDSREFYDGRAVLADRVSQQLLRDLVTSNPSLDLGPGSLMLQRTSGI